MNSHSLKSPPPLDVVPNPEVVPPALPNKPPERCCPKLPLVLPKLLPNLLALVLVAVPKRLVVLFACAGVPNMLFVVVWFAAPKPKPKEDKIVCLVIKREKYIFKTIYRYPYTGMMAMKKRIVIEIISHYN